MIQKEVALASLSAIAIGVFLLARTLNSAPAELPPEKQAAPGEPVAVADPKTNTSELTKNDLRRDSTTSDSKPDPTKDGSKPNTTKSDSKPHTPPTQDLQPSPPTKPAPQPIEPPPQPTEPTPQPTEPAPSVEQPTRNPDDAPERKKTGTVTASTDTALPPAYGPLKSKVHVVVYSDFQ